MAENTMRTLTGDQIRVWPQQSQQKTTSSSLNRVPHCDSAEER